MAKKNTGKRESKVKKKVEQIKVTVKELNDALKAAYDDGYASGWEAHDRLPKVRGAKTAASAGFNNGLRAHSKSTKAKERVNRAQTNRKPARS